jgi:hypothetical protein
MVNLNIKDCNCTYDTSQEAAGKVVEAIINWCNKYQCNSGEMLCQDDDCMIESPYLVADIIDDILKFNCEYKD